jgi:hypothetical protein
VIIRLQRRSGDPAPAALTGQAAVGADDSHKSTPQPHHLS